MSVIGGDAPALFAFAAQVRERRANIAKATQKLSSLVSSADWKGPDRDKFIEEWTSQHAPALMDVCTGLDSAADRVVAAAQRQEQASSS